MTLETADNDNLCDFHEAEAHSSVPTRKVIAKGQLLINGKWVNGVTGKTMDVMGPTTEASITHVQKASAEDAKRAIDSACEAFEKGPWGRCVTKTVPRFFSSWPI